MMMVDTFLFLCLQFWQASPLRRELLFSVTPIIISRFYQSAGNNGVLQDD